ncbi:hypothetical protein [Zobellia uliginosa]|uniref:hypothetical protein n=1 Tax=Zobellia uliginosa TaxID=143224 RepID=UPI0026E4365E|nr:hypothetical protein [Zobellia uliginosa]MDO6518900.1 hypothetical protein [Zobellia uliginosa]
MKETLPRFAKSSKNIVNFSNKKPKYRFRLVDFKNKDYKTDLLLCQTQCNLEILPKGVMVVGNFDGNDNIIPLLKDEIRSISLIRGKETIDTFCLSPMHILLKLGIPSSISRYFKVYPSEHKITETQVIIKCDEYQLKLITSGNDYGKLLRIFKKAGYTDELNLIQKPTLSLLNYNLY